MTVITARLVVADDGTISTATQLPPGEYVATIEDASSSRRHISDLPFDIDSFPVHDVGPWPEGLSLRREDIYGDDGR